WLSWMAHFPPSQGLPGDPLTTHNPFTIRSYLARAAALLRTLLFSLQTRHEADGGHEREHSQGRGADPDSQSSSKSFDSLISRLNVLLRFGVLSTAAGVIEGLAMLEVILKSLPAYPENLLLRVVEEIASSVRKRLETAITEDDDVRCKWE